MGYLKRKKRGNEEKTLQKAVVNYLKLKYKNLDLLIRSDLAGVNLSFAQQSEHRLKSDDSFPDLAVYYPNEKYLGFFLELKKAGTKVKNRSGEWYKGHIAKQAKTLQRLRDKGYYAEFGIGIDNCIHQIDEYFKNQV